MLTTTWVCSDSVEVVFEGISAASQAIALRLSSAADRHPLDASGEVEANLVHLNESAKLSYH